MFLPATFLKLHAAVGSNVTKTPLVVLVKPNQIIAMSTVNAKTGKEDDPNAKDVELTKLVVPYSDPFYVQEPPEIIMKMIIEAFNSDVDQINRSQGSGLIMGGATSQYGKLEL